MASLLLRTSSRLLAVTTLAAGVLVLAEPTPAVAVPQTLADRRPVQPGPVEPGFPIDHLGVLWDDPAGHHGHPASRPETNGAVRFRTDDRWGPWIRLIEDGAEGDGLWASGLVPGGDAEAYQVRGIPEDARSPRAVAINTTDGPETTVGERAGGAAGALSSSTCRSRMDWGADESLRFTDGTEAWPPEFHPVQTVTVHHTATTNDDPDPAATVRAIYRYHAVDKGWGDIGYQYLVDESGVVYEGRWSGTESTSCLSAGGDGADFGHEDTDLDGDGTTDEMVTAAHVGGGNSGNMGVALLGEFTDHPRFGGDPTTAAVGSLEDVLTELAVRHGLDPTATVEYVNPVNGERRTVETIPGHLDWVATECPGERLYAQLPDIRQRVKAAMGGDDTTPEEPAPALGVSETDRGSADPLVVGTDQTMHVFGDGFTDGAAVALEGGKGHTPTVTSVRFVNSTELEATVTVEAKGPSSAWDVRVTLPGGATASCSSCAHVRR